MGINKNVKIDSEDIIRKRNTLPDIAQRRNAIMDTISGANANLDINKIFSERNLTLPSIPANHRQDFGGSDEGAKALTSGGNADNAYSSESQLNDWMNLYENQKGLSDGINGDAIYEQFKDMYNPQGKMAMEDTMGSIASALTGGYGNSYATSAGYQAYQSYLQNTPIQNPDLYQMAYDLYGSGNLNNLGIVPGSTDILASVPSDIIDHIKTLKSNAAIDKYLTALSEEDTITEDQMEKLYGKYKKSVSDYSERNWTLRYNGDFNWGGGFDNNAEVTDQYNNTYTIAELFNLLQEEEGLTEKEATDKILKLQKDLEID